MEEYDSFVIRQELPLTDTEIVYDEDSVASIEQMSHEMGAEKPSTTDNAADRITNLSHNTISMEPGSSGSYSR